MLRPEFHANLLVSRQRENRFKWLATSRSRDVHTLFRAGPRVKRMHVSGRKFQELVPRLNSTTFLVGSELLVEWKSSVE